MNQKQKMRGSSSHRVVRFQPSVQRRVQWHDASFLPGKFFTNVSRYSLQGFKGDTTFVFCIPLLTAEAAWVELPSYW